MVVVVVVAAVVVVVVIVAVVVVVIVVVIVVVVVVVVAVAAGVGVGVGVGVVGGVVAVQQYWWWWLLLLLVLEEATNTLLSRACGEYIAQIYATYANTDFRKPPTRGIGLFSEAQRAARGETARGGSAACQCHKAKGRGWGPKRRPSTLLSPYPGLT